MTQPASLRRLSASPNVGTAAALAAILALGLVLRIVFWYGLVTVDPAAYADSAESIARGIPSFNHTYFGNLYYTQYIRLSLTVPAAVFYRLFGPGEAVSTIVPIGASLGMGLIAFELARRGAGKRAGLIAAFLAVIFPVNVINSTQFLPDTMMAFFAGLTILLFLTVLDGEHTRRQRLSLYFGVGVAWSLAFYGRQTAVGLMIPFGALIVLRWRFHRRFQREIFAGVPGALLVVLLVQVLLMNLGGTFLEDLRTTLAESHNSQPGALQYTDLDLSYIRDLLRDPMFIPSTFLGGVGFLFAVAAQGKRRCFDGMVGTLVVLIVGQYLYFEFLMRLPSLYSWWKEPRYVLSMMLLIFVLAGIGLSQWIDMLEGSARRMAAFYVTCGLLFALAVSLATVRNDHAYWRTNRVDAVEIQVADYLKTQPPAPLFTWDDDFARYISPHIGLDRTSAYERQHNEGAVRNRFDVAGNSLVEPGSFVVVNDAVAAPGLKTAPDPSWQMVWEKAGVLKVYRVPPHP
jgi:4-amino-4-deoxy-L-arabinose transferase-like glycosyltransferase